MCLEYDQEYALWRAEQARKAMQDAEEKIRKASEAVPPKPAPRPGVKEVDPVPA